MVGIQQYFPAVNKHPTAVLVSKFQFDNSWKFFLQTTYGSENVTEIRIFPFHS